MFEQYLAQDTWTLTAVVLVSIVLGGASSVFGYRIFKILLGTTGFILGSSLGFALVTAVLGKGYLLAVLGALGVGVVGAYLMVRLYFMDVFVLGAGIGGTIGYYAGSGLWTRTDAAVMVIAGVVLGALALVLQKLVIILFTAFGGSWCVVSGFYYLFDGSFIDPLKLSRDPSLFTSSSSTFYVLVLTWALLATAGILVQYWGVPEKKKKSKRELRKEREKFEEDMEKLKQGPGAPKPK